MARIVFSEAAREDRRAVTSHSVETFGVGQARRLRNQFARTPNMLADNPRIGRLRAELDPPGHTFRYFVAMSRFIIVYEPVDEGIQVARILHGMRNLADDLSRDPGERINAAGRQRR